MFSKRLLKLAKTTDCKGFTIHIRERESFFTPSLLKALTIALIFHFSAFFLFHIKPFQLSSHFTFPSIQVHSDTLLPSVSTYTREYQENEELSLPPLAFIPMLDWLSSPYDSLSSSLDFSLYPFLIKWPEWQFALSLEIKEPQIQLHIAGELAHYSLLTEVPLLNQMVSLTSASSVKQVIYRVRLDDQTGEIFWYECEQSSGIINIDHLTEQILLNLRFDLSSSSEPIIDGTVSFSVSATPS